MARLGFLDTEGNIFHINENPDNSVLRKKKKKDEDYAMANAGQTVKPTDTVKDIRTVDTVNKKKDEEEDNKLKLQDNTKERLSYKNKLEEKKAKEKEEGSSDSLKLYGKAAKTGLVSGITGIPNAELQEMEGSLKKGKEIKNAGDVVKQVLKTVSDVSNFGKISPQEAIGTAINFASGAKKTIEDKDKDAVSKALGIGTSAVSKATDMTGASGKKLSDAVFPLVGAADKNADKKVKALRETINKPSQEMQEDFAKELQNYGGVEQTIAQGINAAANMAPSLATAAITKNPQLSMAVMANNVKGQATEDALRQGKSLEEAREIGNAKAAAEVATELATGGLNIFGKGALDDVAEQTLNKVIKNPTANYVANKALGIVGENLEESASNILDKAIDKGTIDPNAKLTMNDITEPWGPTTVSSLLLNAAGGGYTPKAYQQYTAQRKADNLTKVQNLNEVERETLTAITQKRLNGEQLDDNDIAAINVINNKPIDVNTQAQNTVQQIQTAVDNGDMTVEEANTQMQNINNQLQQTQNNQTQTVRPQNLAQTVEMQPTSTNIQTEQNTSQMAENTPINEQVKTLPHSTKVSEVGYHASNQKFDKFDTTKIGTGQGDNTQGKGINLASVKDAVDGVYGKNTYKTNINLENAYTVDDKKLLSTFEKDFGYKTDMDNISDELQKKGYDGIVINVNGNKLYTVFDSKNLDIVNKNNVDNNQQIEQQTQQENESSNMTQDIIQNAYKQIQNNNVKATIAPYYNTPLTKQNYGKIRNAVETSFNDTANNIATLMGGKIKDIANNIGGFTFEEGENAGQWVKELSYTYELEDMPKEDAMLFTSLMGDLGHEQQEAVIAASYEDIDNSNALEFRFNYKNRDKLSKVLDELGIHDYTIDTNNKTLKLLEFDDLNNPESTAKKIADIVEKMGGDLSDAEYTGIQSEYITKGTREGIYKTWLESNERSQENRELYSLVEQAYEKVKGSAENEGTSDSSFSDEELAEEKVEKQKITVDTLKKMSKDITKDMREAFKLKKGEAYSKTPQTTVKSMSVYDDGPSITDFNRDTVVHTVMSDEAAKIDAEARYKQNGSLEENAAYIRGLLQSDKRLTKNDKALAIYTMKQAYEQGNKAIGDGIVSDLTVLDVEAGQWAQASKLMKQMTPYGQLQTFVKMVNNSVEKGNPRFKNVKITEEQINKVLDCYEDGKWNADKFAKNMEEFKYDIQQQMTPTLMDKFNSVRMLGMLGAPRTHIRNILGNVGNLGLRMAKNFNDRVLESIVIRGNTEQRTRTFKPATKEIKNYVSNITKEELFGGNKYNDTKTELERNMKTFKETHKGMAQIINPISKGMNKLSDGNSWALDMEDKLFSSVAYKKSLQEYLTAKGIKTVDDINNNPKLLAKGKEFAMQQALEATYRQDSELATAISNYVKKAEKPNAKKTDKFLGLLVESNIPFKKTPINIAKTGIDYSPIGLVNGVYDTIKNVKSGKVEMAQAIDEISKGITGLGLLGIGALLAHNGFELTAADDEKDKKAKYDKSLGEMEYSIKIGDRYYDLAWMAPASMPLYTGIELYQTLTKEKKFDGNAVVNTIAKTVDPLSSMSLLEGLSKSVKSYSKTPGEFISKFTMSSLENYVTQYVPTLLSQIANIKDDKKRTTTPSGKSSFTEFDKTWNSIKIKVPFLRETLPEQTDAWGRVNKNEDLGWRFFNSLINPANNSKDKKDATDKELERLYKNLGEDNYYATRSLPKMDFDKYLTYNKEKHNLSNKELVNYKKLYGKTAKDGADKLIKTKEYKNATDEEKAKMLSSLYDYANQKAKEEYGKKHGLNYDDYKLDQLYSMVDAFNIPIEKAVSNKSIQQLRAEGGTTAKQRKISAVDDIDGLTSLQKDALKRKFTMFMGNPGYKDGAYALVDAIENSNVSEETKKDIKRFLSLD